MKLRKRAYLAAYLKTYEMDSLSQCGQKHSEVFIRAFSCSISCKANFFQVSIYIHALVFLTEQFLARRMKEKNKSLLE